MKHVTKSSATPFSNADSCSGIEYSFDEPAINGSLITISGRYPERGYVRNRICKEMAFVVRGSGKLRTETETIEFSEGDTVLLDSGECFYWEGDFDIYTVCSPAFDPEQHEEVVPNS